MLPSCQQNSLGYSWHSLSLFFFFFSVLFLFFLFFHFFTLTLVSFSCCHSHSVCFQALSLLLLSIVSIFFLCQPPLLIYYLPCSIFLACHPSPSTHSISFFKSRLIWSIYYLCLTAAELHLRLLSCLREPKYVSSVQESFLSSFSRQGCPKV